MPSVARTSFLQSAEANLKSAARTSYTLTTPALQSARAHTVAVSSGIHGQHTATTATPGAERGEKLQKRLACDPEGDSELKKIEEKFKWLHSQNRRDSKGRTSQARCSSAQQAATAFRTLVATYMCESICRHCNSMNTCRIRRMMGGGPFKSRRLQNPNSRAVRSNTGK